jgi:hypothetical protein
MVAGMKPITDVSKEKTYVNNFLTYIIFLTCCKIIIIVETIVEHKKVSFFFNPRRRNMLNMIRDNDLLISVMKIM